jgi:CheY-like chemotaxis protein
MTRSLPPRHIVLYADDDIDDLQLVKEAFDQYASNVDIVTVNDGVEALSYLESLGELDPSPCLIILDINMPRMDGKETLRRIRKELGMKEVPVVLFTTSSMPVDRNFAHEYKAGFLTKPIDIRQMEAIADEFIEHCTDEIKKKIQRKLQ